MATGLTIAIALAFTACGGQQFDAQTGPVAPNGTPTTAAAGGKATTPAGRLLAAAGRTSQARTARMAITMKISGAGDNVSFTGSGVMDLANKRFSLTLQSESAGVPLDLEMRVIGDTAYVRTGSQWISETVASTGATTPVPSDYLEYLQGISGAVRTEGHETLRGVATTRYGATLDLDRALARVASASQRATIQHALDQFGLAKFPVTVWVDGEGRLRKMVLSMDLAAVAAKFGAPAGTHLGLVESIELYDFGVAVEVTAPSGAVDASLAAQLRATESDLRNALTAEKTIYTDNQMYSANTATLAAVEPSLDWGGRLRVVVAGSGVAPQDMVCLSERSQSGVVLAIADVSDGPDAGTYYGRNACPTSPTASNLAALGAGW
jgi:hypothetical protein